MTRPIPLYAHVKDALRARIERGELAVGQKLPSEQALAKDFGCSRLTAHRALRELAEEGLLIRRRRAGTVVAPRDPGGVLLRVPRVRDEVEGLGLSYSYTLLQRRHTVPPSAVAELLLLSPGTKALQVVARHSAGARVFGHEDRWINPAVAPQTLEADFAKISANEWLLEHVPYSSVDHEITARSAGARAAGRLEVPEGTACLQIRRLTHLAGKRVTYAVLLHPADLVKLRSETRGFAL